MIAICIVSPWTTIPGSIIFIIMFFIRSVYLSSSRDIKRMESTSNISKRFSFLIEFVILDRSPIFGHLTESMKGLTTIRAYGAQQILEKEFDTYQDLHTSIFYMYLGSERAFAFWLDTLCVLYVSFITVIALIKGCIFV